MDVLEKQELLRGAIVEAEIKIGSFVAGSITKYDENGTINLSGIVSCQYLVDQVRKIRSCEAQLDALYCERVEGSQQKDIDGR